MLQVDNQTQFCTAIAPLADVSGVDTLFVCVKATFGWYPRLAVAPEQRPIALCDHYRGDPQRSSLIEAGEHHIGKRGTDVVLDGSAHAPGGKPTTSCPVSVAVANRRKVVAVYGDRTWDTLAGVTDPQPFVEMPLQFERALAGPANPVGVGLDRSAGAPVPNLEDPNAPVTGGGGEPRPVCFGPVAPGWQPRASFAGTYDAAWQRRRAPLLPADFDRRFFNVAADELAFDYFLQGGEAVEILGASRRGRIAFTLPRCRLAISVRISDAWESIEPQLETVALWPDDDAFSLTWRAKYACDRKVLAVERVRIELLHMEGF